MQGKPTDNMLIKQNELKGMMITLLLGWDSNGRDVIPKDSPLLAKP